MADEQDWAAYTNATYISDTDTFLLRRSGGSGLEAPASLLFAKASDGVFSPIGKLNLKATGGSISPMTGTVLIQDIDGATVTLSTGGNIVDGVNKLDFVNRINASGQGIEGQIAHSIRSVRIGTAASFEMHFCGNLGSTTDDASAIWKIVTSGNFYPAIDNAYTIGNATFRISTLYAATGTINTSDERDKSWLQSGLVASDGNRISANIDDDAFYRAGLAIIKEFGFYQWLDAIDEKGTAKGADGARIHFGPRAQRVFAAFQAEGVEPARLAMCCYDEWADQFEPILETRRVKKKELQPNPKFNPDKKEGPRNKRETMQSVEFDERYDTGEKKKTLEAGNRYGLRLDMLNSFLGSVRDRRQDELDARIAKLEASAVDGAAAV